MATRDGAATRCWSTAGLVFGGSPWDFVPTRLPDLMLLVAVAILESFGYRQVNALWGCIGTVQALTGKGGWGSMKRKAFRS